MSTQLPSQVCKKFRELVDTEPRLQYTLLLDQEAMVDGPSDYQLTVEERLFILRTQRSAWATLTPEAVVPFTKTWGACMGFVRNLSLLGE